MEKINLSPTQRQCINFRDSGELLVRGIPGSGKTTVLLERARRLAAREGEPKVVMLTFNKSLANYVKQLSVKCGPETITAMTFHQWGYSLLQELGIRGLRIIGSDQRNVVKHAYNTVRKYDPKAKWPNLAVQKNPDDALITFLEDEIEWIKGWAIASQEEYLATARVGRGASVRLTKAHRETIYHVYEKYQSLLRNLHKSIDGADTGLLLAKHASRLRPELRPAHVLVDEAQDLSVTQLRVVKSIVTKSLTLAADQGQKIYRAPFSWKDLGIDVTGDRSRALPGTFRSTKEIVQLARSLQAHDRHLKKDVTYVPVEDPIASGGKPELYISGTKPEELETVLRWVQDRRATFPEHTIAIVAQSHSRLEDYAEALAARNIPHLRIKEDDADVLSPGVKLVTYHSVKGLEFHHVIATDLKNGVLPFRLAPGDDEADFLVAERRKLYVAMTRARLTLAFSARKPVSDFIDELDPKLYVRPS